MWLDPSRPKRALSRTLNRAFYACLLIFCGISQVLSCSGSICMPVGNKLPTGNKLQRTVSIRWRIHKNQLQLNLWCTNFKRIRVTDGVLESDRGQHFRIIIKGWHFLKVRCTFSVMKISKSMFVVKLTDNWLVLPSCLIWRDQTHNQTNNNTYRPPFLFVAFYSIFSCSLIFFIFDVFRRRFRFLRACSVCCSS